MCDERLRQKPWKFVLYVPWKFVYMCHGSSFICAMEVRLHGSSLTCDMEHRSLHGSCCMRVSVVRAM